jgi:hypothetical protein
MSETQKKWMDHFKNNFIPLLSMIGVMLYYTHNGEQAFFDIKESLKQSAVFQVETKQTLGEMKAQIDTLKMQFHDYKMQQDYNMKLQEVKHQTELVTERHTAHGLAFIAAK